MRIFDSKKSHPPNRLLSSPGSAQQQWHDFSKPIRAFGRQETHGVPGFTKRLESGVYMGVEPKIWGILPPKWMVKIMESLVKMDDLGVP